MSVVTPEQTQSAIEYPETDGQPMAENTLQFQWIVTIKEGLDRVFAQQPEVFVAGDLFWYPVEGRPDIRIAPDTLIVLGRPKGHRRSYKQWEEGGVAPQVVFEVLSPGNRPSEMLEKLKFYETYGVDEYYVYDPDNVTLAGYLRVGGRLRQIHQMNGWTSLMLGIRFVLSGDELAIFDADGRRFLTYQELADDRDTERERAEQERERAEQERERAEQERQRADRERQRADRLAEQLRALGVELEP